MATNKVIGIDKHVGVPVLMNGRQYNKRINLFSELNIQLSKDNLLEFNDSLFVNIISLCTVGLTTKSDIALKEFYYPWFTNAKNAYCSDRKGIIFQIIPEYITSCFGFTFDEMIAVLSAGLKFYNEQQDTTFQLIVDENINNAFFDKNGINLYLIDKPDLNHLLNTMGDSNVQVMNVDNNLVKQCHDAIINRCSDNLMFDLLWKTKTKF